MSSTVTITVATLEFANWTCLHITCMANLTWRNDQGIHQGNPQENHKHFCRLHHRIYSRLSVWLHPDPFNTWNTKDMHDQINQIHNLFKLSASGALSFKGYDQLRQRLLAYCFNILNTVTGIYLKQVTVQVIFILTNCVSPVNLSDYTVTATLKHNGYLSLGQPNPA